MVSTATIISCILTLLVSLVLPAAVLVIYGLRNKGEGIWSAWFLGAAGFFVTQILIRLPVLSILSTMDWFVTFAQEHYWLYAFSLAFTAGLFELAGRFVVAKLMRRRLTFRRSLAAGLGHGGIEAMLLVGMTYISNLAIILMINSGAFDALIAQSAAAGVDAAQLELVRDSLLNTSAGLFLLGGFERFLAMTAHAAMSVLVCYGLHSGKTTRCLLVCLGLHTLIDCTAGISGLATDAMGNVLSQNGAYAIIYTILAVVAILSIVILKNIRSCWGDTVLPAAEETNGPEVSL